MSSRPRVIIASPDRLEREAIADWLGAEGLEPVPRATARAAVEEIEARPFDLAIADAVFAFRRGVHAASRARRPLTPTVVVGDAAVADRSESLNRQAMHLVRPLERPLLVCTVSMAIIDGRPLRCSARKPVHRFNAIVNGVPSHIIDVSNEGLRLELPRDRRSILPPYFNAQVPIVGVAVTVQRMWARIWSGDGTPVMWCGGAIVQSPARAAGAWRSFVDTMPAAGAPTAASLQIP